MKEYYITRFYKNKIKFYFRGPDKFFKWAPWKTKLFTVNQCNTFAIKGITPKDHMLEDLDDDYKYGEYFSNNVYERYEKDITEIFLKQTNHETGEFVYVYMDDYKFKIGPIGSLYINSMHTDDFLEENKNKIDVDEFILDIKLRFKKWHEVQDLRKAANFNLTKSECEVKEVERTIKVWVGRQSAYITDKDEEEDYCCFRYISI